MSCYNFDEHINDINIVRFRLPNEAWLDFVFANRRCEYVKENYDIVIGSVANDDVYTTFNLYDSGVLTKEQTLQNLKT